jgi:hypothetical protein
VSSHFATSLIAVLLAASPGVGTATSAPRTKTAQQAVTAIEHIVDHNTKRCALDWSRIHAAGTPGNFRVTVVVRSSRAGRGTALWTIGQGHPVAGNPLAKALAHGCG